MMGVKLQKGGAWDQATAPEVVTLLARNQGNTIFNEILRCFVSNHGLDILGEKQAKAYLPAGVHL